MRLEVGRVDQHRLWKGLLAGQPIHHPGENTFVTPALPLVVEGLRRTVLLGRIAPPQTIATDEDNATQNATIIDARPTMALGKEGLQPRHLRIGQPEKVAQRSGSLRRLDHAKQGRSMGPDPKHNERDHVSTGHMPQRAVG
jgi:hypothetical protein